jgi:hypothetical protein
MISDNEVGAVHKILQKSAGKTTALLAEEISATVTNPKTKAALIRALHGDNRPLNSLLYRAGESPESNLIWVAPIKAEIPRYVWMLGKTNRLSVRVHGWFNLVREALRSDSLLQQHLISPPLLFVDATAISSVTLNELQGEDEFAIFQTGYEEAPDEVSDLDQRMVMNMKYSITKRTVAQERMERLFDPESALVKCCRENLELFAILHNEGHNQGHFVGSWPHEDVVKKHTVLYEAVEEFRACVAAVLLAQHLPLTKLQKQAFALSVFATRCLGFGYDAYFLSEQRRETAREIAVGLFFLEWLVKEGVVYESTPKGTYEIREGLILEAFIYAFAAINEEEKLLSHSDADGLREIAIGWYQFAFPGGDYSQTAKSLYNQIQERG